LPDSGGFLGLSFAHYVLHCVKALLTALHAKRGLMSKDNDPEGTERKISFHYIKGSNFRSIYVDGAIGSVTPAGNIHCAIYNERPAIPRTTHHILDQDGRITDQGTVVDGRDGFVRELEADLIMSLDTARSLSEWLNTILKDDVIENEEGTIQ
jgi:hypothetical protein